MTSPVRAWGKMAVLLVSWAFASWIAIGLWTWLPGQALLRVSVAFGAFLAMWVWGFHRHHGWRLWVGRGLALVLVVAFLCVRPSRDGNWIPEHARAITADVRDGIMVIDGVRDFRWLDDGPDVLRWTSRQVPLDRLDEVWFFVDPFAAGSSFAHVFLSFSWLDQQQRRQYLAISIEARREFGEDYHPIAGCFRHFEIIYVVADEADVLGERARRPDSDLRMYRGRATPAQVRTLFLECMDAALRVEEQPIFYHSLRRNCAGLLARHLRRHWPGSMPWPEWRLIATANAAEAAQAAGLIEAATGHERITERARLLMRSASGFGSQLRKNPPAPARSP